jgi:hypothetical protein
MESEYKKASKEALLNAASEFFFNEISTTRYFQLPG